LAKNAAELKGAIKKIEEFEQSSLAKDLHAKLVARAKEEGREHWLEEWWDDGAYMGYRDSVVVNVSYYYGFNDHPAHLPQGAKQRAAALTRSALLFRRQYKRGLVAPEATKEGALCMDTWRWMFDCCRVPGLPADWTVSHAKEGDLGDGGHIIVIRRGRFWKVDVGKGGELISTVDLEKQLDHIYKNTDKDWDEVGVLTSNNRDVWAKDYETLLQDPRNAAVLKEIHSSAFILCLDTWQPQTPVEHSLSLWHGGPSGKMLGNRWVDKPVQFIVADNGKSGIMGEHSVMDGTPTTRMCDDVLTALQDPAFDHGIPSESPATPTPLDWNVTPEIQGAIQNAKEAAKKLTEDQTLGYLWTDYGKALIKKFGFSPDSWTQMIIQLAYARLAAENPGIPQIAATYEAATTRRFRKGRTEAIRVVTTETQKFVKAYDDDKTSPEELRKLFKEACARHIQDAKEAGKAQGIDRHIMGLKMLAASSSEPAPALFSDPLFKRSNYWVLSTSAIFSKHFDVYGWGEVVPDGFGVAYMTGFDDHLLFTVTSRKEMPNDAFIKHLLRACNDLRSLFEASDEFKSRL
jgi:carnitine O-acetyltransferase